ncbi:MAG: hypothetical protein A3E01_05875 [Gammaproteobacteria bacterium RIFCSPHIGHO2_12_FULL_63_22]|nr:MAG: hypothetical protein A3E01_05875 [Gammaproteobacteria bacterium RIFCSPHIGHO2_12_FULL_63_22]
MSSRLKKNLFRLEACPKDYTWNELTAVMRGLGFVEAKGSGGSAVKFRHPDHPEQVVNLHKPHNRNPPTVLVVYLRKLVARLKEWGYLDA